MNGKRSAIVGAGLALPEKGAASSAPALTLNADG